MVVIRELAEIVAIHELDTEVLAASIRHPRHMTQAALAGAHVATLPFKVLQQMVHHPLTDMGIVQFRKDWEKARRRSRRATAGQKQESRPAPTEARRVTDGPVAATEEILGQFLGDATFPVSWDSEVEKDFFWVYDDLHIPHPVSPMFFDIGGWWLCCDHMFRRFGTPFAVDWLAKNVNGYVYTTAIPADPDLRIEATEYSGRYGARVPSRRDLRVDDGRVPRHRPAVYGAHFADWWRDRSARDGAQLRLSRGRLDAADGMSLAEIAYLLEDAIDIHDRHWKIHWMLNFAQLSATLNLRAVMEKHRGPVDERCSGASRTRPSDRNWDSIEALWQMKNEVRDDPELRAAFTAEERRRSCDALAARANAVGGSLPSASTVPARVRLARRLEPRVHLPHRPRAQGASLELVRGYLTTDYDFPTTIEAMRQTSRPPRARSSRA